MYYKIVGLQYLSLFNLQSPPVWCLILYCIALYCIVLYRIVLYCIVSYPIILYCIVLYSIVLYCIVSYCIVLYLSYRIILYCIISYYIVLYCTVSYHVVLYCIVYRCTSNPSHKCYTKLHQIFRILDSKRWILNCKWKCLIATFCLCRNFFTCAKVRPGIPFRERPWLIGEPHSGHQHWNTASENMTSSSSMFIYNTQNLLCE